MFDWDDQELANIIWGEGSEGDDHIVPFPEDIQKKDQPEHGANEKNRFPEQDTNNKVAEQSTSGSSSYLNGGKTVSNDGLPSLGVVVDAQLDLPSFSASNTEEDTTAKKNQIDIGPGISQNQHEDKELGELVGNSWANIGSFDDLDRIFSNDDLDAHTNLGSSDQLWSSSKNLLDGSAKSSKEALDSTSWEFGTLGHASSPFDVTSEYLSDLVPGSENKDVIFSRKSIGQGLEQEKYNVCATGFFKDKNPLDISRKARLDSQDASEEGASSNRLGSKGDETKHHSNHVRRADKFIDARPVRDMYDKWPSTEVNLVQFDSQGAPTSKHGYGASVANQQELSQEPGPVAYQNFSNPYVTPYAYANVAHQYPDLSLRKPRDDKYQSVLSKSTASRGDLLSGRKPVETAAKMTPQEKIEKLRRRQQMRALLAIQKQQQQLDRQASSIDYSLSQKSSQEEQVLHMDKAEFEADESMSTLPCYDPGSPSKKDDPSGVSNFEDYSVEDRVLYQLQDIVARLDMKISLCIRDSLYRLAHSAMQRTCPTDTSNTHRSTIYNTDTVKEEISSNDRSAGTTNIDAETIEAETNHIDRVVAHLLFHRPYKLTTKHAETPESSTSTKFLTEHETAAPGASPFGFLTNNPENRYNVTSHGTKSPSSFVDVSAEDMLKDISQTDMDIDPLTNSKDGV